MRSSGWCSDAESHAEDDRRQRELAEARNNGENAAYQAERQLKDLGEAVDSSSKEEIEEAIKAVRESLTSEDAADINAKTEALHTAFHKVSEAMYQRAQEQAAASSADGGADGAASTNGAGARRRMSSTPKWWTRSDHAQARHRGGRERERAPANPRGGGAGRRPRARASETPAVDPSRGAGGAGDAGSLRRVGVRGRAAGSWGGRAGG